MTTRRRPTMTTVMTTTTTDDNEQRTTTNNDSLTRPLIPLRLRQLDGGYNTPYYQYKRPDESLESRLVDSPTLHSSTRARVTTRTTNHAGAWENKPGRWCAYHPAARYVLRRFSIDVLLIGDGDGLRQTTTTRTTTIDDNEDADYGPTPPFYTRTLSVQMGARRRRRRLWPNGQAVR